MRITRSPPAAAGLSPFHVDVNEEEVTVPSAHAMARRCRKVWVAARQMLLRGQDRMKAAADHHRRPAPAYTPGQKVDISIQHWAVPAASLPTAKKNCKVKATSLPPHREWDCAIDLLPGAPIPKARLYSISGPERKAMEEYIESSLRSGIIRPSSSPARTGFFFVDLFCLVLRQPPAFNLIKGIMLSKLRSFGCHHNILRPSQHAWNDLFCHILRQPPAFKLIKGKMAITTLEACKE
ncbi:hypothetical protein L3Q82_002950 [Scortum barcoo]|uniref:Uncharacterized protein n=1 Tax=Scortum barcoo TaxID=214431 RepID=A0ACB8VUP3_9TELE|nr:hypothetical protein L3Q82_002950 [Scortum barcoo]